MTMQQAEVVRRVNPLRMLLKGILHLAVKMVILIFRAYRYRPLPALIVTVVILGSLMLISTGAAALPLPSAQTAAVAGSTTGPRVAVETYLAGQREYNARLMWEAMSEEWKAEMRRQGQTPEATQQRLDAARQGGVRFLDFKYVGGTGLDDGRTVYLYIISLTNGQETRQDPYTFTLNKAGKIIRIE